MSYRIRQGYVRHDKSEGRIVTLEAFAHKLNEYIRLYQPVLFGTITLEPDAIYQYGTLERVQADTPQGRWVFVARHGETAEEMTIDVPYSGIVRTYDVEYTVKDEQQGDVAYPVFYMTATDPKEGQTLTYYIGSRHLVSRPLDCIAEFFVRSHEVGKEMKQPEQRACSWKPPE